MIAESASSAAIIARKLNQRLLLLKSVDKSEPEYVQNTHTKKLMHMKPIATRIASLKGSSPVEYPDEAAKAIAQILGFTH